MKRTISAGAWHVLYIDNDGTLWAWGFNGVGQLGVERENPKDTKRTKPVQVSSDTWRMVDAGVYHSVGIQTDGTLWAWGLNRQGQLGVGRSGLNNGKVKPTQVSSDTWRMVTAGPTHTIGIKTDGTLWAWGFNKYGLGFGDTDGRSSPTQIGTDTWRWVDTGTHHTVGVKTDGTLWTWGYNTQGQLGFEDTTNRSSPTQVGSDTWRMASAGHDHTVGIKTDGTLQLLGENRRGITAPVVKGKWRMVDAGEYHVIGIKEDGTLWAWGWNWQGQLGIGNTTDQNSFTQIGSDTWQMVNGGQEYSSCGIKNDGTPWTWGSNRFGQLGIGNTANQNAPVQVTFL